MARITPPESTRGSGRYDGYHALWHLFTLGLIDSVATFDSDAWGEAEDRVTAGGRRTRVALIDVSVTPGHPNLDGAIAWDLAVDFFSSRLGTFPEPNGSRFKDLLAAAKPIGDARAKALFTELTAHLAKEDVAARDAAVTAQRVFPATSAAFSGHGTAMAGLIGARPVPPEMVQLVGTTVTPLPNDEDLQVDSPLAGHGLPYIGIDPTCEIVPISTSFDPDPEQFLAAMLYAHIIDADLIVLARDFPDPWRSPLTGALGKGGTVDPAELALLRETHPVTVSPEEETLWDSLHDLVPAMSMTRPILCASGNGGDTTMLYPGLLASDRNGIILVGAHTSLGTRAGYSNIGTDALPITLYAPSGDSERLDSEIVRLDQTSPDFHANTHAPGTLEESEPFSALDVISTDVPGAAGYNGSPFPEILPAENTLPDYRSYYCRFSGTSAATAIASGVLALAMSTGKVPRGDGVGAKKKLRGSAAPTNDAAAEPKLNWARI
ncbi:S8 family serine peptidase [Salipiger sp. H15]|uniref:S8 family serine peptidase n=1 Tax=Alloyangia sp. H15 TaxID=3029062 RepID=A0AAU8ACM7_9RHOB